MKTILTALVLTLLMLSSAACALPIDSGGTGTPGGIITGQAQIESIQVLILESFPVQVNVALTGTLPDGCTTIGETTVTRDGNTFTIAIATNRPSDAFCTQQIIPFEQSVSLDVLGLEAGDYTVVVGSQTATFNLAIDNVLPDLIEPTGAIEGRVWHDLCAISGGEGGEPAVPSANCIDLGDGSYAADGILTPEEPGIAGVEVRLHQGSCDGPLLGTTMTNADGAFAFEGLEAGIYCVLVDPLANPNSSILIPGEWTSAAKGSALIELSDGQVVPALNFGWDYQFLPEPEDVAEGEPTPEPTETGEANDPDCTNEASFVDETLEDGTVVGAGADFTKTWTLENTGTCRWEKDSYSVVFVDGDQMGAPGTLALAQNVPSGEEVTFTVNLTAPGVAGTYRGNWMIQDADGNRFGLGSDYDDPFWVEIKVEVSVSDLDLGAADWTDNFSSGANWFLPDTDTIRFSIEDEGLRMRARVAGAGDFWNLSNRPALEDFYIEAVFTTGGVCSGQDRYGLLIRSPEPSRGYVFNVSCNGQFRIYEWNGTQYNQLQGWTSNAAIKSGPNATNTVGVWAEGDTLQLYINSVLVTELDVDIYDGGRFGLLVGSTNTTNFDVYVERVSTWTLDD